MSYFGGVWSSLKFSSGNAAASWVARTNLRLGGGDGQLIYKNQRHQSVLVHVAKQMAMSTLEGELNKLLPKFERVISDKERKSIEEARKKRVATIIADQGAANESCGILTLYDKNHTYKDNWPVLDSHGNLVPEALVLSYTGRENRKVTLCTYTQKSYGVSPDVGFKTSKDKDLTKQGVFDLKYNVINKKEVPDVATVFLIDLAPQVSMHSAKNVVLTQVQGRDYTRKELVSGGDLEWSVKGNIVSDEPYVYPTDAVQDFLNIMQHNGILDVNHMMFNKAGVTRVIIKDFSLDTPTYKNIQPYSFSCVAVEPDEEIQVKDTIIKLNEELQASPMNEWYNKILKNKWGRALTEGVMSSATSLTTQSVGMGLDALVPNI